MAKVELTQSTGINKPGKSTKGGTYYVLSWLPLLGIALPLLLRGAGLA